MISRHGTSIAVYSKEKRDGRGAASSGPGYQAESKHRLWSKPQAMSGGAWMPLVGSPIPATYCARSPSFAPAPLRAGVSAAEADTGSV